jgi:hypothetical protein
MIRVSPVLVQENPFQEQMAFAASKKKPPTPDQLALILAVMERWLWVEHLVAWIDRNALFAKTEFGALKEAAPKAKPAQLLEILQAEMELKKMELQLFKLLHQKT